MSRRLIFEPGDGDRRFILCYQALCFAPAEVERNEVKAHGTLFDTLESIGTIANPLRGEDEIAVYRCVGGGEIVISEPQFTILKRFVRAYIKNFPRALSREYDRLLNYIDDVTEISDRRVASAAERTTDGPPQESTGS